MHTQLLYSESICGLCIQICCIFVFLCPSTENAKAARCALHYLVCLKCVLMSAHIDSAGKRRREFPHLLQLDSGILGHGGG